MLLFRPSLLSCVARSIMISRASGSACDIATKLYCPPTPLTTWPESSASLHAAPSAVTIIVVFMKRPLRRCARFSWLPPYNWLMKSMRVMSIFASCCSGIVRSRS